MSQYPQSAVCLISMTTVLVSKIYYTVKFSIFEGKSVYSTLLSMGYHLYTDNWYTAVALTKALSSKGTNLAGTVGGNRKQLPVGVKQKLSKGDSTGYHKEKLVWVG